MIDLLYRENLFQYARLLGCRYDLVHLRTFDRRAVLDLLRDAGFTVERMTYDSFLAGHERRWVGATAIGARMYQWMVRRRYGELAGVSAVDRRLGRLLIQPATAIAVARKRAGIEHAVIAPITYAEQAAASRSTAAPAR